MNLPALLNYFRKQNTRSVKLSDLTLLLCLWLHRDEGGEGISFPQLEEMCGLSYTHLRGAVKRLEADESVITTGTRGKYQACITDTGAAAIQPFLENLT